jgi:UDPglucose 6-dehydrogenase
MLIAEGCSIRAFDPAGMARAKELLPSGTHLSYVSDEYAAANDVDALLILTDWSEFGRLDLQRVGRLMRYPIVVDGRNLYDPDVMLQNGITYFSVGRQAKQRVQELAATGTNG